MLSVLAFIVFMVVGIFILWVCNSLIDLIGGYTTREKN